MTLLPPAAGYPAVSPNEGESKNIDDDLFMESWKQVHQWIKLIEPLTRCGKPSIETVAGCRQHAAVGKVVLARCDREDMRFWWSFVGTQFFWESVILNINIPIKIVGFLKSKLQNNVSST